jgi:hypothetical protein
MTPSLVKVLCGFCGKEFELAHYQHRQRKKNTRTGNLYCSVTCSGDMNRKRSDDERRKE